MKASKKFDAIVIGTGQAGVPLAKALADKGWKLAVIEHGHMGGSCVNFGCTPTKAMVASARRAYVAKNSSAHGVVVKHLKVDLEKIVKRKDAIVRNFRTGVEKRLTHKNISLYRESAEFVGPKELRVGKEVIKGKRIFINTGQSPFIPSIPGLDSVPYLTSTSLLDVKQIPKHLLIMGGGYVGLEFGQMYRRFGSQVTIVQKGPRLAMTEDPDIEKELRKTLSGEGVKILLNSNIEKIEKRGKKVDLLVKTKSGRVKISGSHLLVATGRTPNTKQLKLDKAGIKYDERGYIKIDNRLETNVKNIWALGDVRGGPAFTHTSYNDYEVVFRNLFLNEKASIDERVLVYALFTDPSLGRAGLTESQARKKGYDYVVAEYPMTYVARAIELGEMAGKMKIVIDKKTDKILGAAILGYEGAELVQVLAAYMNVKASYKVVQRAVAIHPTLVEGIQSLALRIAKK